MANKENATNLSNDWIDNQVREAVSKMFPTSSKERYELTYKKFQKWRNGLPLAFCPPLQ
jgi:hypothetical protein